MSRVQDGEREADVRKTIRAGIWSPTMGSNEVYAAERVLDELLESYASLVVERDAAERALWGEWRSNHGEHCIDAWPHEGMCHYDLIPELVGKEPQW